MRTLKCGGRHAVSQCGNTIGAPAYSGLSVCFLCLSLKDAVSPRGSQIGACCSSDLFGCSETSHSLKQALWLFNQEHGAFAGYSHLLSRTTLGKFLECFSVNSVWIQWVYPSAVHKCFLFFVLSYIISAWICLQPTAMPAFCARGYFLTKRC